MRRTRRATLSLLLLVASCGPSGASPTTVDPATLPSEAEFLAAVDKTMGYRDIFKVLRDPVLVPAADAPRMRDDERVLGLDIGSVRVAYPIQLLNLVEIVEHSVAGRELLVCWCALCGTGVVHGRRLDDRVLSFGHAGWLWRNAFLLYDQETDSIWHHVTGVAMSGPLRGRRLPFIESTAVMTFGAWRAEHPDTVVVAKNEDPNVDVDVYAERNSRISLGLALALPGVDRWYPFDAMAPLDAVEDEVAGVPVVVVRDAEAATSRAFDRRVGGAVLSFTVEKGDGTRPMLRERGGRRAWWLRSGAPSEGDPAAPALRPLPATPFERNAWTAQHPAGSVWRRP
jgi:hypothetical protein